jgi:sulfide:quinone oxidoreductase
VRPRSEQLRRGITYRQSAIDRVDIAASTVHLAGGGALPYDVLVVATGAVLVPEETEGSPVRGGWSGCSPFYTPEGAGALEAALATFDGG